MAAMIVTMKELEMLKDAEDKLAVNCSALSSSPVTVKEAVGKGGRITLKMLCRKSNTQFENQERNTQNAIAIKNYSSA
jgi:hypothetical protein